MPTLLGPGGLWDAAGAGDQVAGERFQSPCSTDHEHALAAALGYAHGGWPVCPWGQDGNKKYPLTDHGHLDATVNETIIMGWWRQWPNAIPAIATGEPSGIVALDIDVRPNGNGFVSLEYELGTSTHPESPTVHTPRGGCAVLFRWPGHFVKTVAGKLAPFLDIRGDGGSILLPPGPGRWWDPHLGLDTPIAAMPERMHLSEPEKTSVAKLIRPATGLSPYSEAALDGACNIIISAPAGRQEATLNSECFSIGTLAGAGAIPADFARRALLWAANRMTSYDHSRPWKAAELEAKVQRAFGEGMRQPRVCRHG